MRDYVLLVDDDKDVAETLRLYLESRGFAVAVATTCAGAQQALSRHHPRVVVTDVRLPDATGREVASAAHAAGALVIALTGEPDPEGTFDATLFKPCPPRTIVAAVEQLAARSSHVIC
jgi:DNA-binding response OmpR family regulator